MNKLHRTAALVFLGVLVALPALAEQVPPSPREVKVMREDRAVNEKNVQSLDVDYSDSRNAIRMKIEAAQKDFEMKRKAIQDAFQVKRDVPLKSFEGTSEEAKENFQVRREEITEKLQERRAAFKEELTARRDAIRTQMMERKEVLKERLTQITDERKAAIALRVDGNLTKINEARVAFFTQVLDRIEAVLERLAARDGADGAASQISAAESAISAARDAVAAQASKDYTVTITDAEGIRSDLQAVRDRLRADLLAVRSAVQAAHQAVRMVAISLDRLPGDEPSEPTTTSTL